MNISFKAEVLGLPKKNELAAVAFSNVTKNDTKHTLVLQQNKDEFDRDVFVLKTHGQEKARYSTEFNPSDDIDALRKLRSAFNMLKIYEAQETIKASKIEKQRKLREECYHREVED